MMWTFFWIFISLDILVGIVRCVFFLKTGYDCQKSLADFKFRLGELEEAFNYGSKVRVSDTAAQWAARSGLLDRMNELESKMGVLSKECDK